MILSNRASARGVGIEFQAVIERHGGHLLSYCKDVGHFRGHPLALEIDITRRATSVVRRQQHTALQHEPLDVPGSRHARQESLQGVELQ